MKIFLSYSRQDNKFKDEIKKTLSKIERDGEIKLWVDDKELKAGDLFDEIIEKELNKSDIFLLLLSRDFWASDYIQNHELPLILEQHKKKKARVVPIILRDNDDYLEYNELKEFSAIPQGEKSLQPIIGFEPADKAYNLILKEIKKILLSDKDVLPIMQLCCYSLKSLSPYNDLEKIELKKILHSKDGSFDIEIIEHFDREVKRDKTLSFKYNKNERHILINKFQKQLSKVKNQITDKKIISKYEILNYLQTTTEALFPVPSKIKKITSIIETDDVKNLTNIIKTTTSKKLLVYGSAGIGKTSTISALKSNFSDGLVIIYDSFGGGTYKDFGAQRHLKRRILTQIINEIAIEFGLELLVKEKLDIYDLELKFKEYLNEASTLLVNKKIIIVIDAADNNIDGAKYFDEEPYVPNLWSIELPPNCYLIMSARGGLRKDSLQVLKDVEELELKGFTPEASTQLLTQYFPKIDNSIALLFHKKTKGIPRLEDYLLQEINGDIDKLQAILNKNENISLEHIFEDIWEQAIAVIQPITKEHIEELICLSRPAKLENFTSASGLDGKEALKIIETLNPGITINNEHDIGFQDEDFEIFLSNKLDDSSILEAHSRIAKNLISSIEIDKFATKNIAFHLEKSKQDNRLIDISLNAKLSHIEDRLERKEIQKDRIKRAIKVALSNDLYKEVFQLLFISAEIIKSDESLEEFLQHSSELLSVYTSEENAVSYFTSGFSKLENFSYRCAYLLSKKDSKKVEEFLKIGDAWLKDTLDNEDRHGRLLDTSDIAKRSAAVYYTKGIKDAIKSFRVWRLWYLVQVIDDLPKDLLLEITVENQEAIYNEFKSEINPFVQAQLLVLLNSVGNKPSEMLVNKVAKVLYRYIQLHPKRVKDIKGDSDFFKRGDYNKIAIDFSILALNLGVDSQLVSLFLSKTSTRPLDQLHNNHSLRYSADTFIVLTLNAEIKRKPINAELLIEEKQNSDHRSDEERKRKIELIKSVLPYFQYYAKVVVQQLKFDNIKDDWYKLLKNSAPSLYHRYSEHNLIIVKFQILTKILIISQGNNKAFTSLLADIKHMSKTYNVIYAISPILLNSGYINEAFELIDFHIDIIVADISPANEKIDLLQNYAEFARVYNTEKAREYFELALEATNGLDDNAYYLSKSIYSFIKYAIPELSDDNKIQLANKSASIADSILGYLERTEGNLLNETIEVVAELDISLALKLSHKWDNSITHKLEESLARLIPIAIRNDDLSFEELFAFRYLIKDGSIVDTFFLILDKLKGDKRKLFYILEKMEFFIRKNLPDESQDTSLSELRKWLEENNYTSHKITLRLHEFNIFHESISPSDKIQRYSTSTDSNIQDWDDFLKPYLSNFPPNLKEMDAKIKGTQVRELLLEVRKRLRHNQKIQWLETLCSFETPVYNKSYFKEFLFCIKEWNNDINVKKSIAGLIEKFIQNNSSKLLKSMEDIVTLCDYVSKEKILKIILENELKHPFSLYLESIYLLMDKTKELISKHDAKEISFDFIERLENRLEVNNIVLEKHENINQSIVDYLWKLLGHPDRRIRWKARYSTRELMKVNSEYLPLFIDKLSSIDGFPFTDDLSFYVISAKESLLIVFHRLSYEMKAIFEPYILNFKQIVFDDEFPHIILREISKSILFNISKDRDEKLIFANNPISCFMKEKYNFSKQSTYKSRFDYDKMDTIRYWYENLQRVFSVNMSTILEKSDIWIIDKWGQNNDIRQQRVGNRWERDRYYLTDHRHGSLPTIEEPIRHLEFETMFLVAGELLRDNPVNISRYTDGDECKYKDFLERYFKNNNFWYSEFREAKPLEPFLWGIFDKKHDVEKFDKLLGIGGLSLVLNAQYDVYASKYSESINISSALIEAKTSNKLLGLLQKADYDDYYLPTTNEYEVVKYKGFTLIGWIDYEYTEFEQDTYDPYLHQTYLDIYTPSNEFIEICNLSHNKYKTIFTKNGKDLAQIERWSDEAQKNEYDFNLESSGSRMRVDIDTMLYYLKQKDMDLIISVKISTTTKDIKKDEDKYFKKSVIYLLQKDGILKRVGQEFNFEELTSER